MIRIEVYGKPEPGGSKTAFWHKHTSKLHVKDSNPKASGWKGLVIDAAIESVGFDHVPLTGALFTQCFFYVTRPKGHYGSGKNAGILKSNAPTYPTTKPDATKLWRSTEDALTGIIWGDDAQIVHQTQAKFYADGRPPGACIRIFKALEV
jgi:Holliday junction resolvase RusA-like endonuclease